MGIIQSLGQISNAIELQAEQNSTQKVLRTLESLDFNPNVTASAHTNPSIPDTTIDTGNISKMLAQPGSVQQLSNPNLQQHTNPGIKDPGQVISNNIDAQKSPVGNKLNMSI